MKPLPFLAGFALPALLLAVSLAAAPNQLIVTSVNSEVGNGYVRRQLADGSFQREYYALANGGYSAGGSRDPSIDSVKFPALAGLVAEFLAGRNYYFAPDAKSANLLLVISWGTTIPTFQNGPYQSAQSGLLNAMNTYKAADAAAAAAAAAGQGMSVEGIQSPEASIRDAHQEELYSQLFQMQLFDDQRRKADEQNARTLGYLQEIDRRDNISRLAGAGTAFDDLISDVEEARYYVVLAAYDFCAATRERKQKLLWVTRISIRAQGNRFDRDVPAMLASAARYFGQDSHGLIRRFREGVVKVGELKVLGVAPDTAAPKPAESAH